MLNAKKKFGIGLTLAGMALLLLAFLAIPWHGAASRRGFCWARRPCCSWRPRA